MTGRLPGATGGAGPFGTQPGGGVSKELEPSAQTIRNWVAHADQDAGKRSDGLTAAERDERRRPRKEVNKLKVEKEILKKAAAGFAQETDSVPPKNSNS